MEPPADGMRGPHPPPGSALRAPLSLSPIGPPHLAATARTQHGHSPTTAATDPLAHHAAGKRGREERAVADCVDADVSDDSARKHARRDRPTAQPTAPSPSTSPAHTPNPQGHTRDIDAQADGADQRTHPPLSDGARPAAAGGVTVGVAPAPAPVVPSSAGVTSAPVVSLRDLAGDAVFGVLPLCIVSVQGNLLDWNGAMQRLLCLPPASLRSLNLFQLAHPAHVSHVFDMMLLLIAQTAAERKARAEASSAAAAAAAHIADPIPVPDSKEPGRVQSASKEHKDEAGAAAVIRSTPRPSSSAPLAVHECVCLVGGGELRRLQWTLWPARHRDDQAPVFLCAMTPVVQRSAAPSPTSAHSQLPTPASMPPLPTVGVSASPSAFSRTPPANSPVKRESSDTPRMATMTTMVPTQPAPPLMLPMVTDVGAQPAQTHAPDALAMLSDVALPADSKQQQQLQQQQQQQQLHYMQQQQQQQQQVHAQVAHMRYHVAAQQQILQQQHQQQQQLMSPAYVSNFTYPPSPPVYSHFAHVPFLQQPQPHQAPQLQHFSLSLHQPVPWDKMPPPLLQPYTPPEQGFQPLVRMQQAQPAQYHP